MSVYGRFKKNKDGFRQLVELLETTPASRRQKMVDVGMKEDPDYTLKALQYVMSFEDVMKLEDGQLAEVVTKAPARTIAMAICPFDEATKTRWMRCAKPQFMMEIKELLAVKFSNSEIGGAQLKVVATARELERAGKVKVKHIPLNEGG